MSIQTVTTTIYDEACPALAAGVVTSFSGPPLDDASGETYVLSGTYANPTIDWSTLWSTPGVQFAQYCYRVEVDFGVCTRESEMTVTNPCAVTCDNDFLICDGEVVFCDC